MMFKLYLLRKVAWLFRIKQATILSVMAVLSACSSTIDYSIESAELLDPFRDELFPTHSNYVIESTEEVFSLSDEALTYMAEKVNIYDEPRDRIKALVYDLFSQSDFKLSYVSEANTTAADTFQNRSANCLSMSIMAYSLAEKAGLEVEFQKVKIPEYWTNREGFSLLNGHINLRLSAALASNTLYFSRTWTTVDFDPLSTANRFRNFPIKKDRVLAMFYNNKGADAFLRANYDQAYAYFKASAITSPNFDDVWVNLGYLYKIRGDLITAEQVYKHALALNDDNYTGWENLAILFKATDREKEAQDIQQKVEKKRSDNPYYHLMLADQEFHQGNLRAALKLYRKAIKLDDKQHEFYFGLAKTYYELGDFKRSAEYLRQAKRNSNSEQERDVYQGKLDLFSKL
jgi:tetratricopeptide (TPR) repeat protein